MLCQILTVGISFVAFTLYASAKAQEGADDSCFEKMPQNFI